MDLRVKVQDGIWIVYLAGKLDVFLSIEAEKEFNRLVDEGATKIIVNMESLTFLSSSGLRVFIALLKKIGARKGQLLFCSPPETVKKVFQMVELGDLFCICENEDAALVRCREPD